MDAFSQQVKLLVLSPEKLKQATRLTLEADWIFDASQLSIDETFVLAYQNFLNALKTEKYSRVLVAQATYLSLFPNNCIVVPTLGEAEDLIEMERIERDLGF